MIEREDMKKMRPATPHFSSDSLKCAIKTIYSII
jgi:hypothetical protein